MISAESYRKICLEQQTELWQLMKGFRQHDKAMQLFLSQHAMLHSAKIVKNEPWSFEDEVLDDMPEEQIRRVPQGCEHSVAWLIWHIARCEDITMNLLVAGNSQILHQGDWLKKMKITTRDTGNTMNEESVVNFSRAIDIGALRAYRLAVGCQTEEIASKLQPAQLKQKVDPTRLQRVRDEGAVEEAARAIVDFWGRCDIAGLLLMPATRHNLIHLNEALRLKRKRQ